MINCSSSRGLQIKTKSRPIIVLQWHTLKRLTWQISLPCVSALLSIMALCSSSSCVRFAKKKVPSFHYEIPREVTYQEIKDRKLEWSDYTGKPDYTTNWVCYTYIYFAADVDSSYNYALPGETYEDYVEPNLKMHYFLTSESWVKRSLATDAMLNHEQTRWNIALMCGMEFEKTVRLLRPIPRYNWRFKVDSMFRDMLKNYSQTQTKYEDETNNGLNKTQQKNWDSKVLFTIEKLKN